MSVYFKDDSPHLEHIGVKFRSGRYPYGSGENPYQHDAKAFRARVAELRSVGPDGTGGLTDKQIAKYFGISTGDLRAMIGHAKDEVRADMIMRCENLRNEGLSYSEIGRRLGIADTSVHSYLNEISKAKTLEATGTAEFLKEQVDSKGLIDVSGGTNYQLNISNERLEKALFILQNEGYEVYNRREPQATRAGKMFTTKVLCPPGTEYKDIYQEDNTIHNLEEYTFQDGVLPKKKWQYPQSLDSKRVKINYAEDGGDLKDGLIEIRPGVDDLSLNGAKYAQVRILVDGTHYIKGMAAYSNNLPDGVDVMFNTNKPKGTPMCGDDKFNTVLKKIKDDPDDPFGSLLREEGGQHMYTGKDGKEHLSCINKTRQEGDWGEWSKELPAQFLSKQPYKLIKQQLNLTIDQEKADLDEIMSITQPNVKKKLLMDYAEACDAKAVDLKAASLPGQVYKAILPVSTIKDGECYAPDMKNGEKVALVRFPHAGTFEIPVLTVNNRNKEAKELYGNATDGIGIGSKAAAQLSGADFDGDTVIRIPISDKVQIANRPYLKDLEGFDAKVAYPAVKGMKVLTDKAKQNEMGKITNLIADMTIKGAPDDEVAMAVKHSMCVIDAPKHKLNYKASEIDNHIDQLKEKWQKHIDDEGYGGASTLITLAKNPSYIAKRKGSGYIDRETGEHIYKDDPDRYWVDSKGKVNEKKLKIEKMRIVKDAHELSTGTKVEDAYADYANTLKGLANQARLEYTKVKYVPRNASAATTYAKEIKELEDGVRKAEINRPRERMAHRLVQSTVDAKKAANPHMTKEEIRKEEAKALVNARLAVGAKRQTIELTDRQWEAIQASAISGTKLNRIFAHVDSDSLRKRATPRKSANAGLSKNQVSLIKSYNKSGYTIADIAEALGVSTATVSKYINE